MRTSVDQLVRAAQSAAPVYAPLAVGSDVRLPLGRGVRGVVVDIDSDNGAVICAWRQGTSCFESWFLAAHLQRIYG